MTDSPNTSSAADRLESGVAEVHVPQPSADAESWLVRLGVVLPAIGIVLILFAYQSVANETNVAFQMPYLISGGLLGVALILCGLALYLRFSLARLFRFWMARQVLEQQAQTDRLVEALARVEDALRNK
jgi:hypothetical protein